jgi:hypothetical protein
LAKVLKVLVDFPVLGPSLRCTGSREPDRSVPPSPKEAHMEIRSRKALRYTFEPSHSSGGRKSWERIVTAVDRTQRGAKGLIGTYLRENQQVDLADGTVIVEVDHRGAATNTRYNLPYCVARVVVVRDEDFVVSGWFHWTKRYLDLLDRVEAAIAGSWPAKQGERAASETAAITSTVLADPPTGAGTDLAN